MLQRRPYCDHPRSTSFKYTPLAIAFLGLLTYLTPPPSLLAAEDPYASITPVNVDSNGNWTPLTLTGDLTTDAPDYYIGAREGGSSYYDILKINKNGTTRVTGNRIHVFSRPMNVSTGYNNVVNFWLHTNENREHGTNTVIWDAELIVDSEGAVNHSNYYPITQGIATDNYATDYYPGHTAHTNVDFLKPVSIRVNNNSSLTDNAQSNSVIALGIKDSYNKASHLTFHHTVTANSTSALARPVSGIVMESKYADTGDGMPTLHFKKDATFTAQSTGGGDALGAKFYATGWTDDELNTSNSALDDFSADDIEALRNTVHQQKLITDAGSTLTLNAVVKSASRRTRGSAIGLSTFAYPRSEQIFELAGKTVVSATSELYQTTKGLNHRVNEGTFKATFGGGLDVTSKTAIGESYGVDTALVGGSYTTEAHHTNIHSEGSSKTWGLLIQSQKPETAEDSQQAVEIKSDYKDGTTIEAISSGFYTRALELSLQNTTSSITFDQLNATSTGSISTQQYTFGIRVIASHKVKSTMSIDELTLNSSGHGVLQSASDDSQAEMTIRNATVVGVPGYAFIASTGSGATDTSHIRLEGSLSLPADGLFATGVGSGAWIETDLTQAPIG